MDDPIPRINWADYTLAQKYSMMHQGPGGAAAQPLAEVLGAMEPHFTEAADAVASALSTVGMRWQGPAASGFTGAMRKAGEWARQSSPSAQTGSSQVHSYASSYDATRSKIPNPAEVAPVGANSFAGHVADAMGAVLKVESRVLLGGVASNFGVQSDYSRRLAAQQQAEDTADHWLGIHQEITRSAVGSFPTITPAPPLIGTPPLTADPSVAAATPGSRTPVATTHPGGRGRGSIPTYPGPGAGAGAGNFDADPSHPPHSGESPDPVRTFPSSWSPPPPPPPPPSPPVSPLPVPTGAGSGGGVSPVFGPPMPLPPAGGFGPPVAAGERSRGSSPPAMPRVGGSVVPERTGSGADLAVRSAAGAHGGGPGGMPGNAVPGLGGAAGGSPQREHRNDVVLPSDEPFYFEPLDYDDVVPPVLGLDPDRDHSEHPR